ncbi:hypothetical protein LZ575_03540 [Antarcticibacterium sp. 1MA-6-2]|uniref:hypothetical protein n=1 Tax=Antarcticibacterium sp. 1MA-6-2 TaxID=2908210 RepID=UPI001F314ED1|nr:hypothetical protein [Antarcticibacterium sp. 1MA-6-2]UJH91766.1 hypothetical protein LZ575_03540 [Antarcticibacterium sp. 1MA-6-2]
MLTYFFVASLLFGLFSCKNEKKNQTETESKQTTQDSTDAMKTAGKVRERTFTGDISPINTEINGNTEVSGTVKLRLEGNLMRIVVTAEGLAPNMMHMQHLQTSEAGKNTQCPGNNADSNNDGIVDVTEVSPNARGIYMIPLHMGPSSLDMMVDTYPRTNVNGEMYFTRTISLDSLREAVGESYKMTDLDFTRFNYVVQGVREGTDIPLTAQTVTKHCYEFKHSRRLCKAGRMILNTQIL